MGRLLFAGGTVGTGVLAQDEKIAAVGGRSFAATEGLEVRA